jgi:hypothetical protein
MKEDIIPADRREIISSMEPLLLGARHRYHLTDLALDLTQSSVRFRTSLPTSIVFPAALAGRWMPGLFPEQPT